MDDVQVISSHGTGMADDEKAVVVAHGTSHQRNHLKQEGPNTHHVLHDAMMAVVDWRK